MTTALLRTKNDETALNAPLPATGSSVTQKGLQNTNIENANQVIVNPTYYIGGGTTRRTVVINPECCSIFIVKDEKFDGNCFTIQMERIFDTKIKSMITTLNDDDKTKIRSMPSLFMDTNKDYRRCADPSQEFYYGVVTDITTQGKNIKIHFERLSSRPMYQQKLNEMAVAFGINTNNGKDVLDETGWIIKKMNLLQQLTAAGFDYS